MKRFFHIRASAGFTLIELMIALAIVALFVLLMLLGQGLQLSRGEDARRKADLAKLKVVFEDYYNDHNCYPSPSLLQQCGSSDLAPYVAKIPCDPRTKAPYPYYLDSSCGWYALYTTLGDVNDPVIETLGCSPTCGVQGQTYNYIQTNGALTPSQAATEINSGGTQTEEGGEEEGGTPTPTPTPDAGQLACDPSGQCNVYQDPVGSGCPATYTDPTSCQQACLNPANRCSQ